MLRPAQIPWEVFRTGVHTPCCSAEWTGRDDTQFLSCGNPHGMGLQVPRKAVFGSLKFCLPWWISHCSSAFPGSTNPAEGGIGQVVSPALGCPYPWGLKSLLFAAVRIRPAERDVWLRGERDEGG